MTKRNEQITKEMHDTQACNALTQISLTIKIGFGRRPCRQSWGDRTSRRRLGLQQRGCGFDCLQ